jgi:hypothetical protein
MLQYQGYAQKVRVTGSLGKRSAFKWSASLQISDSLRRCFDYLPMLSTPGWTGYFARETYVYVLDNNSMTRWYDEPKEEWSRADTKHDLFVVCRGLLDSAYWFVFVDLISLFISTIMD